MIFLRKEQKEYQLYKISLHLKNLLIASTTVKPPRPESKTPTFKNYLYLNWHDYSKKVITTMLNYNNIYTNASLSFLKG